MGDGRSGVVIPELRSHRKCDSKRKVHPVPGAGVSMAYKNWRNGQAEVPGCPSGDELRQILENALRGKTPLPSELERVRLPDLPSVAEFFHHFDSGQRGEIEESGARRNQTRGLPAPYSLGPRRHSIDPLRVHYQLR